MRLKSILYKKEQDEIIDKLIKILELDEENSVTLHDLDTNQKKQKNIMDLIPEIRKYFAFGKIGGVKDPEKTKRPYLSIVKNLLKQKHKVISSSVRITVGDKRILTKRYYII